MKTRTKSRPNKKKPDSSPPAEEAEVAEFLQCSKESLEVIADTLPALVWTALPDGRIDYINQQLVDYAALPPDAGPEGYFLPVHPDDQAITKHVWEEALKTGKTFQIEHRLRRYDGVYRWYLCRSRPVRDGSGRIVKWYGTSIDIDELRETQEKLAASESKFRWLFDSSLISALFWNTDGVVIEANQAFCEMVGSSREEILAGAVRIKELTPQEWLARDLQAWDDIERHGFCQPYEKEFLNRRTGQRVPVLISGALLLGSRTHGVAFAVDLSERKAIEEALRSNETTLKLAIEAADIGTFDFFPLENRLIWSDLNRQHFGLPPEAPVDFETFLSGLHPDDREQVLARSKEAMAGANNGEYIDEFRTLGVTDSQLRWLTARGKVLFDQQGQAVRFIGTTLDITKRKLLEEDLEKRVAERTGELAEMVTILKEEVRERTAAERSLRESESLLKTVLDTLPVAVWVVDSQLREVAANPAARKIWGSEGDKRYKAWLHGCPQALEPEEWGSYKAVSEGETTLGAVYDIESFDGRRKTILYSAVPLKNEIGTIIGAIVLNEDITERFRQEQALQAEIGERLRALEELRQKDRLLMHQSRLAAMGEMIGNIAHQWRQPLNSLGLIIQGLSIEYELGAFDKIYLEKTAAKAMQVINHMSRTIDDFRNFFRPDKEKVSFHAREVVTKAVSLVDASFQDQHLIIHVDIIEDSVIFGYPNEYSQVLLNILMNARDAFLEQKPKEPMVVIRLFRENERAVITISDNAGGIAETILEKIFDPYFTTKGPDKGTGIGLFMAKTIIEKNMNGSLSVRNTDTGAEFRIEV